MGISKKVSQLLDERETIHKFCEKCRMDSFIMDIPIIARRKEKEWERQHAHKKSKWNRVLDFIKGVRKYGK